jgi:2-polyprenyl-3-methyl-5-hydroxy-6-metoxy-1,4-benzoquinol methylase
MNTIVAQFIQEEDEHTLEDKKPEVESLLKLIRRFKAINAGTKILEIGVGSGWFQILCKEQGLSCRGLEIDPQVIEYAKQCGKRHGITPDIALGDVEKAEMGTLEYDIIIATSTFEHVKNWREGINRVFKALKPGGLFYFYSTNKFSFKSGEYDFPLYGWFPDNWRYRLRKALQGEDIMEWGIDFNQFTYFQLRRFFKTLGFSKIFDIVDILDPECLNHPTVQKKIVLKMLKTFKSLKHLALFFSSGTCFICIK